jgi:ABC-2 type transport system permease protein
MDMTKQLTGFWTMIHYTIRKLLLSKRIFISLLILLFIVAIMAYASTLDLTQDEIDEGKTKIDIGVDMLDNLILFFFLPVMAMIFGSSLVRDEMDDRSITAVVTSPMDRSITFIAYYIGLAVSVSLIMVVIATAGVLSYFGSIGLEGTANIYGNMVTLVVLGSFAYSSLFIMISVLLSKPIYFGLFYAFIWEGFIASIPGRIQLLSVKHYVRSLGTHWIDWGDISMYERASSVSDAAWVLVIFSIVSLAIGAFLFRDTEFT